MKKLPRIYKKQFGGIVNNELFNTEKNKGVNQAIGTGLNILGNVGQGLINNASNMNLTPETVDSGLSDLKLQASQLGIPSFQKVGLFEEDLVTDKGTSFLTGFNRNIPQDVVQQEFQPNIFNFNIPSQEKLGLPKQSVQFSKEKPELSQAEQATKLNMIGEGLLNIGLGSINAIQANKAFKEFSKLKRPSLQLNEAIKPAEINQSLLDKQNKEIAGQTQSAIRNIKANTGDLSSLLSGLSNINKQGLDARSQANNQVLAQYNQDKNNEFEKQRQLGLKQQELDFQFANQEYGDKRQQLANAMNASNSAYQANIQNLLNMSRNKEQLLQDQEKEMKQLDLYRSSQLQNFINQKRLQEGVGNIYETSNPEVQAQMKKQWEEEFLASPFYKKIGELEDKYKSKKRYTLFRKGGKISPVIENRIQVGDNYQDTLVKLELMRHLYQSGRDAISNFRKFAFKKK